MDVFYGIVTFLSGLGLLLYAVKALGEALDKTTGSRLRQSITKAVNNRFGAAGMGLGFTILLQSSTASMAMFVVLCNAGVISLAQAISVVLGVNVGAAITHIVVMFGSVKVVQILCILVVIGVFIFLFGKSNSVKNVGKLIAAIGLIFLGITVMSQGMAVINEKHLIDGFIQSVSSPVLLILIFMLFTCVIQTSMGAMAVLITFVGTLLPLELSVWAVMGINLGTSISSMLATIGTSINARRVGLTHILFNVFGTIVFSLLMIFMPIGKWITYITSTPGFVIIIFELLFNTVTALILIPFVNYIAKFMKVVFKEPKSKKSTVEIISEDIVKMPTMAMPQVVNNLTSMVHTLVDDFFKGIDYLFKRTPKLKATLTKECIDISKANSALENVIIQLTAGVSESDQKLLSKLLDIVHKNRTILRKLQKLLFYGQRLEESKIALSKNEVDDINEMCDNIMLISVQAVEALKNIESDKSTLSEKTIVKVLEYDNKVDEIKSRVRVNSLEHMKQDCKNVERFSTYSNIINAIEDVSEVFATIAIIASE